MKLPAFQFYPGDWLRDDVSACSLAAQGLWLRMMFVMHDADRYGYLAKNGVPIPPAVVAHRCGATLEQYTSLLAELDAHGVPSRTRDGVIYSRRMVRDAQNREIARKNGAKGGNPLLLKQVNPPLNPSLKGKGKEKDSSGGGGAGGGTNGHSSERADRIAALDALRKTKARN